MLSKILHNELDNDLQELLNSQDNEALERLENDFELWQIDFDRYRERVDND